MKNPWIAIADLLSGFVVVLLLLFVGVAVLPQLAEEAEGAEQRRREMQAMERIRDALRDFEQKGLLEVDVDRRTVELRDLSFPTASACLTEQAGSAVDALAPLVGELMKDDARLAVYIEGHTDPQPVGRLVQACGYFADNTQLSALRAANVRERIVGAGYGAPRPRMPVSGWGPDRLRDARSPFAPGNRRVELRLVWSHE